MAAKGLKEVAASGKLKRFLDRRLIKAFTHPFREHLLAVFNERVTSAKDIGDELGIEVTDFYKHVQILHQLGYIEEVEIEGVGRKPRRGTPARYFRAKKAFVVGAEDWERFPKSFQSDFASSNLREIWDEINLAMQAGTFVIDGMPHITWMPGHYDREAWQEATAVMDHAMFLLLGIRKQSAERIAKSGEAGTPATIAMLGFGTPGSRPSV